MESVIHSLYYSNTKDKTFAHYHDCHQILFVKKGKIEITVNDKKETASSGDLVIMSRLENHAVTVLSESYERYVLRFFPTLTQNKEFFFLTLRPNEFKNVVSVKNEFDKVCFIFKELLEEREKNDRFSLQMQELLVSQLLTYIYRLEPIETENKHLNLVLNVKNELENNVGEKHTLKTLSEKFFVSPSTLSHEFKKIMGVSVLEYLVSCRLATAKKYLAKTDKSISEISILCGFYDFANFSRSFKLRFGLTPSEFREKYKK